MDRIPKRIARLIHTYEIDWMDIWEFESYEATVIKSDPLRSLRVYDVFAKLMSKHGRPLEKIVGDPDPLVAAISNSYKSAKARMIKRSVKNVAVLYKDKLFNRNDKSYYLPHSAPLNEAGEWPISSLDSKDYGIAFIVKCRQFNYDLEYFTAFLQFHYTNVFSSKTEKWASMLKDIHGNKLVHENFWSAEVSNRFAEYISHYNKTGHFADLYSDQQQKKAEQLRRVQLERASPNDFSFTHYAIKGGNWPLDPSQLEQSLSLLHKAKFFHRSTTPGQYKALLSNSKYLRENPIVFTDSVRSLKMLIQMLLNMKLIRYMTKFQFNIASECFVDAAGSKMSNSTISTTTVVSRKKAIKMYRALKCLYLEGDSAASEELVLQDIVKG